MSPSALRTAASTAPRAGADKRDAIADAALELFVERGFFGTAVPEIAERAGVGAGTIYRYFESKEALVNSIYLTQKLRFMKAVVDLTAPPVGAADGGGVPAVDLTAPPVGAADGGGAPAVDLTAPPVGAADGGGLPAVDLTAPPVGAADGGGLPAVGTFVPTASTREQVRTIWMRMAAFVTANPSAFIFLELHHHASYLDADSRAVETRSMDLIIATVAAAQARGDLKAGSARLLVGIVMGGFVGVTRNCLELSTPLAHADWAFAEQCIWEAIRS